MLWTRTLIPTLKELPGQPRDAAGRLLVRAGLIRTGDADQIALLPLGYKVLHKIVRMFGDELDAEGWSEVFLGGDDMIREVLTTTVSSYKQLPVQLYEVDRRGPSPGIRGFSFDSSEQARRQTTARVQSILLRLLDRATIKPTLADSGPGHAFFYPTTTGPDELVSSDPGNYFAAADAAATGSRPWSLAGEPLGQLEKIHTPGSASIEAVCAALQIAPRQILKTLVFQAKSPIPVNWVVAVVRGDHQVNRSKLARAAEAMGVTHIELVDSARVREKFAIGFVGPDGATAVPDAVLVIDPDAAQGDRAWAAGANETDFHVRNFNWFRDCGDRLADPTKTLVADIRNALPGDPSPREDGGTLRIEPGMELARIVERGDSLGATFDDEIGQKRPIVAGSFWLDPLRVLRAVVESHHDDHGICWPVALAPSAVVITPIKYEGAAKDAADKLYTQLTFEGIDTILDDRHARAGFKFADADLIGFPVRVNVGEKHLVAGNVEIKLRAAGEVLICPLADALARIRALLADTETSAVSDAREH
jgi:prolyl-tRNA synthetase